MSQTETALKNLAEIKAGRDPRKSQQSTDVEFLDAEELTSQHDSVVRDRDTINKDFLSVLNTVQPKNLYHDDWEDKFPLSMDDVEFSYCTSSGRYWAKCGPRSRTKYAGFAVDKNGVGRMTMSRYYAVLIHEVTHIEEGGHTQGSAHNPRFWEQFVKNTVAFIESDAIPASLDVNTLVSHVRENPNSSMVDRRMMTVDEQKQAIENSFRQEL